MSDFTVEVYEQFERAQHQRASERTRAALAAKKAQGVRLGRPRSLPEDVRCRVLSERDAGMSFAFIAAALNEDGVATAQGGAKWYPSTVRAIVVGPV